MSFEQERAIDDDVLASTEAGEHFDFAAEIAAAADSANFEMIRILWQEHTPFVANTLN